MKLNVPVLSQRDPQWASQRLGTVDGTTIGGYGCIITCMTMLAQYYGHNLTPADMDNWLIDNQGYVQGNLYRNDAFGREFLDCSFDNVTFCTSVPAPLSQIDNYLAQGKPVVIMVDFDHDPNDGIQTHFVLIVGKDIAGNYFINDPWYGDQVYLIARYGENQAQIINQINFFSGPAPQPVQDPVQPTPEVQPEPAPPEPIVQPAPEPQVTPTQIPVTTDTTTTNIEVPVTTTTTQPIETTSTTAGESATFQVSTENPTPAVKTISLPKPISKPWRLSDLIVWIAMNIKRVLIG